MDEWVDNLGPAEGAESLVREKKDFNIDERVQSQRGQSPLQVLLVSRRRSDQPVLRRTGSKRFAGGSLSVGRRGVYGQVPQGRRQSPELSFG